MFKEGDRVRLNPNTIDPDIYEFFSPFGDAIVRRVTNKYICIQYDLEEQFDAGNYGFFYPRELVKL